MTRYRVLGRPNVPHDVLTDRSVGQEFDADLDPAYAQSLVDAGALEVLEYWKDDEVEEAVADERAEPEPEPQPVGGWEDDGGSSEAGADDAGEPDSDSGTADPVAE